MKKVIVSFFSFLAAPFVVAQAQEFDPGYIDSIVESGQGWLGIAVSILMVLMTIWFLWSVFKFIAEKDPKEMPNRRKQMVNGLIGLFVAVAVWGIIRIATNVFDVDTSDSFDITCPPGYVQGYDANTQSAACVPN